MTHLTDLRIDEVSLVPSPANKGAQIRLFKMGDDLPAMTFAQALAATQARLDVDQRMQRFYQLNDALQSAVSSIMQAAAADAPKLVTQAFADYALAIKRELASVEKALDHASTGGSSMNKDEVTLDEAVAIAKSGNASRIVQLTKSDWSEIRKDFCDERRQPGEDWRACMARLRKEGDRRLDAIIAAERLAPHGEVEHVVEKLIGQDILDEVQSIAKSLCAGDPSLTIHQARAIVWQDDELRGRYTTQRRAAEYDRTHPQ